MSIVSGGAPIATAARGARVNGTTAPTSNISGFTVADAIDLTGVSFANGGGVQLGTNNVLNLLEGGQQRAGIAPPHRRSLTCGRET